jgi:hypothetical protein
LRSSDWTRLENKSDKNFIYINYIAVSLALHERLVIIAELNKRDLLCLFLLGGLVLLPHAAQAQVLTVDLGSASGFAVLAGAGIANAGYTTINGNVGTYPTSTTAGFETVTLKGVNYGADPVTQNAKSSLDAAFDDAEDRAATTTYAAIFDLGGLTLTSGVYNDPSSFAVTGTLTLDAQGNPNAVWIFQAGSTLTTAANSSIVLVDGAQASNVFWEVGTSATLGAETTFNGTILAASSISLGNGTTSTGGVLAEAGAVDLTDNVLTATPEPGTLLLMAMGLGLLVWKSRFQSRKVCVQRR